MGKPDHLRNFKKTHTDPVTGDQLTNGEYISWLIQGVIRRWPFLIIITIITIIAWSTNNSAVLTWWNLCASYLAIVIESIVGMAMFRQTLRDAVVTRETRATSQRIEKISQHVETVAETSIVNEKELCSLILRLEDQDKELMKQTNYLIELIEHAKANRQNEAQ